MHWQLQYAIHLGDMLKRSCNSCEYAYGRFTRKNPGYKCEIEDLGFIVPDTLNESKRCATWERKGSRIIIKNLLKVEKE